MAVERVRAILIWAQTVALTWTVAAAFGPVPRLLPAAAAAAVWLLWEWAYARWPQRVVRLSGLAAIAVVVLIIMRPPWASALHAAAATAWQQWQALGTQWSAKGPLGYGVTAVPLLVLAHHYAGSLRTNPGDSRVVLNAVSAGLAALLLSASYNWVPVVWGSFVYVPLAFAAAAFTRAEELAFARYRGDVRRSLLVWGTVSAICLLVAVSALPFGQMSWPRGWADPPPPAGNGSPGEMRSVGGRTIPPLEVQPPAPDTGGQAEPGEYSPWLPAYFVAMLAAAVLAVWLLRRSVMRPVREAAVGPAHAAEAWPDLPAGPWRTVIIKAFLWLLARLPRRRLNPALTASERVALLAQQRPALETPLRRMLSYFLPARYRPAGAGEPDDPGDAAVTLRNDWQAVRRHVEEQELLEANPGWYGRLRVAWQRWRNG